MSSLRWLFVYLLILLSIRSQALDFGSRTDIFDERFRGSIFDRSKSTEEHSIAETEEIGSRETPVEETSSPSSDQARRKAIRRDRAKQKAEKKLKRQRRKERREEKKIKLEAKQREIKTTLRPPPNPISKSVSSEPASRSSILSASDSERKSSEKTGFRKSFFDKSDSGSNSLESFGRRLGTTAAPVDIVPLDDPALEEARSGLIGLGGGIARRRPTVDDVHKAKKAFRELVDDNISPDVTRPFNAGLLRLAFHDCTGPDGCDGCINHLNPANDFVLSYTSQIDRLYRDRFNEVFSRADFYALGGIVGMEYSMELAGCTGDCIPFIEFKYGRLDCTEPNVKENEFCPTHGNPVKFFKAEFDLEDDLLVAIMGAHTIGRVHKPDGDAWDTTPDLFDNDYFKEMISRENDWQLSNRQDTLNGSWVKRDGTGLMLGSDLFMVSNLIFLHDCNPGPLSCPKQFTRDWVYKYAEDNDLFIRKFGEAFQIMLNKNPKGLKMSLPLP